MYDLVATIGRRRRLVLAAWAALLAVLAPGLARLGSDNRPEVFFPHETGPLSEYRALRADFGSDEIVRLVAVEEPRLGAEALAWLERLQESASRVDGVERVTGPAGLAAERGEDWPPAGPWPGPAARLERALGLVAEDASVVTLLVTLAPGTAEHAHATLASLEGLLGDAPTGVETFATGLPVLNRALDASSDEVRERFFPALIVVAVLVVLAALREPRAVLVALLFVGSCCSVRWAGPARS
jgi:predicted RND superfamily exporter protein